MDPDSNSRRENSRRKKTLLIATVAGLAGMGCGAYWLWQNRTLGARAPTHNTNDISPSDGTQISPPPVAPEQVDSVPQQMLPGHQPKATNPEASGLQKRVTPQPDAASNGSQKKQTAGKYLAPAGVDPSVFAALTGLLTEPDLHQRAPEDILALLKEQGIETVRRDGGSPHTGFRATFVGQSPERGLLEVRLDVSFQAAGDGVVAPPSNSEAPKLESPRPGERAFVFRLTTIYPQGALAYQQTVDALGAGLNASQLSLDPVQGKDMRLWRMPGNMVLWVSHNTPENPGRPPFENAVRVTREPAVE